MSDPFTLYLELVTLSSSLGLCDPPADPGRGQVTRMDDPPWVGGSSEPPSPPPVPQLLYQLLLQVELELSLYVAAAALLYAFMLVFLNAQCPRIVEKNPRKFKIDGGELATRRTFIEHTKDEVKVGHCFWSPCSRGNYECTSGEVN